MEQRVSNDTAMPPPMTDDALRLLREDHVRLRALFGDYALVSARSASDATAAADRQGLLARLALQLRTHLTIVRELLYPLLEGVLDDPRLQRALHDHEALEARLSEVAAAQPSDEGFDARVAALAEALNDYLVFKESDVFPAAARALDLATLGRRMSLRRAALLGDLVAD
jgi:hypothetical protein